MSPGLRCHIAQRILTLRHAAGKSQVDVANVLQLTQQAYSNYETRIRDIPFKNIVKIYRYLGGNLDEIFQLYTQADDEEDTPALASAQD
jgi:transcriptional regulator with XRE-family HTH domain